MPAQKWSKGKMKEKVNNQVLFDKVSQRRSQCSLPVIRLDHQASITPVYLQPTYEKLNSEVPKYKMITASVLSDRLRVRTLFALHRASAFGRCCLCSQICWLPSRETCHASRLIIMLNMQGKGPLAQAF